jgi:hypothetical protein
MPRGPSSFTQEDAVRILKAKQRMERAAQKTGISLDGVKITIGSVVIDFQNANSVIDSKNENPWNVPSAAGTGRLGR